MQGRISILGLLLAIFTGCNGPSVPPAAQQTQPAGEIATLFDPATAGTIRGEVTWHGAIPSVPPIDSPINIGSALVVGKPALSWKHPHVPVVDPANHGVGNAVVFLRNVNPRRARPWDLSPVRVEQRNYGIRVRQGDLDASVGFVQRGASVEMNSTEPVFHILRASGAAFFSLTFPDPDKVRLRRLDKNGLVELSSAAGYSWMRGHLFVDEHPYYCRTDTQGRFQLMDVPPGEYDIVCWMPNWHEASHERDPESGLIVRLFFKPPLEKVERVVLHAREVGKVHFQAHAGDFPH